MQPTLVQKKLLCTLPEDAREVALCRNTLVVLTHRNVYAIYNKGCTELRSAFAIKIQTNHRMICILYDDNRLTTYTHDCKEIPSLCYSSVVDFDLAESGKLLVCTRNTLYIQHIKTVEHKLSEEPLKVLQLTNDLFIIQYADFNVCSYVDNFIFASKKEHSGVLERLTKLNRYMFAAFSDKSLCIFPMSYGILLDHFEFQRNGIILKDEKPISIAALGEDSYVVIYPYSFTKVNNDKKSNNMRFNQDAYLWASNSFQGFDGTLVVITEKYEAFAIY